MSKSMIVAGVMSGTWADGINVALVRIGDAGLRGRPRHTINLLGHAEYSYPSRVRATVLVAMNAQNARVADLARLNFVLGELYADAVLATERQFRVKADLVGCHGQTLYHQGEPAVFLGRRVAATWQIGEGSVIAARVGVPVVSDFRPADMAAGGNGAPLVPYLDFLLFRDADVGRIVQNVGGIANLTAIPAGAGPGDVFAFDTGPGNMVSDALVRHFTGEREYYDAGGRVAALGKVNEPLLADALRHPFFLQPPPKSAGREQFGHAFVAHYFLSRRRPRFKDLLRTAVELTARTIAGALARFVFPGAKIDRLIVSGGGAHNRLLVKRLAELLPHLMVELSDRYGLPVDAKEAIAFAILADRTLHGLPGNLPSVTGARRAVVLGKIVKP